MENLVQLKILLHPLTIIRRMARETFFENLYMAHRIYTQRVTFKKFKSHTEIENILSVIIAQRLFV